MAKTRTDERERSPPKQRRLTPIDADWVLDEWLRLEKHYLSLDYSPHQIHVLISNDYRCCKDTVYNHLKRAHGHPQKTKAARYVERRKKAGIREKENERNREHMRFGRHPDRYILAAFEKADRQCMSMEDISLKIEETYNFLPRIRTLEKAMESYRMRYGFSLLTEVPTSLPPLYRVSNKLLQNDR